ncbi:MAG: uracil-DNA glycosylase, partial [Stenotrophomonas sp.]|nr:uracil-DNA glycosylase [Stenotrophomonas sp.]
MPAEMQRWSARIDPPWSLDAWRAAARLGLAAGVAPEQIDWLEGTEASLLDAPALAGAPAAASASRAADLRVSMTFLELAASVLCHREAQRLPLLYRLLW